MKFTRMLFALLVVGLMVVPVLAQDDADPTIMKDDTPPPKTVVLRYKFVQGQVFRYTVTTDAFVTMSMDSSTTTPDMEQTRTVTFNVHVLDVLPNGTATLRSELADNASTSGVGATSAMDMSALMYKNGYSCTITPTGIVKPLVATSNSFFNSNAQDIAAGVDEGVFGYLPKTAVKVGSIWHNKVSGKAGVTTVRSAVTAIEMVDGSPVAHIRHVISTVHSGVITYGHNNKLGDTNHYTEREDLEFDVDAGQMKSCSIEQTQNEVTKFVGNDTKAKMLRSMMDRIKVGNHSMVTYTLEDVSTGPQ